MEQRDFVFNDRHFTVSLRDEADVSVWTEIFKLREYRRAEETICTATDPIIDVGAHVGFFALYARALNLTVPIFALEPEPENIKILKKHLETNDIQNTTIVEAALGGYSGQGELAISEDSHNHYLFHENIKTFPPKADQPMAEKHKNTQPVLVFTFTDLCKKYNISRISLLKMDIEGGEYAVFESFSSPDYSCIGSIIMEYHNSDSQSFHTIETRLRENGFSVQIFPSHFDKRMGFLWARNKRIN